MKVFDVHAHVFQDEAAARLVSSLESFYAPYGLKPHGAGTVSDCIAQMQRAGITKFAVNQVAIMPRMVPVMNAFILEAYKAAPDSIVPFAAIHPGIKDPDAYVEEVKQQGFLGFKVHPDMQRFALDSEQAFPMFRAIEAAGLPVLIHCGDRRFDNDGPKRVAALHDRLPGLKAINAHFGGWSQIGEARQILAGRHITVDLSGVVSEMEPERAVDLIRAFGTENILFGSDYPMYSPASELSYFMRLPLLDRERAAILWGNAKQIIGF